MAMGAITRYRINWKNRAQMVDFDDGVRFARCCWKGVLGSQSVLHTKLGPPAAFREVLTEMPFRQSYRTK